MTHLTLRTLSALALLVVAAGCETSHDEAAMAYDSAADLSEAVYEPDRIDAESVDHAAAPTAARLASAPIRSPSAPEPAPAEADAPVPDASTFSRHLRRSADLRVATDDYDSTLRDARAVAGRYGGLVSGEDGSTDGELAQTTLTLRVPSDRFDTALDALAALGEVESRAVTVDDVTGQVVDLEARIRAKRAAEARYVGLVAQAGSIGEMLEVQGRLDGVRADIEAMESHARSLRSAVSLSTIRATIVGTAAVPAPPAGVWARAVDGVAAGWHGVLAVLLGVLPLWPLAVLGAAGYAVWRRVSPRVAV